VRVREKCEKKREEGEGEGEEIKKRGTGWEEGERGRGDTLGILLPFSTILLTICSI
jgi:hypothetical protein